jgi:hypothetical protein
MLVLQPLQPLRLTIAGTLGGGPEETAEVELRTEDGIYLLTEDGNYIGVPE